MPVPTTARITSTDGVELAVHDLGGTGPTILFAHATGFHGLVWSPLVEHLVDSFRCVAVDFRGHGDSTPPEHGSFDWSGFADDAVAAIDHLGASSPLYGVGHSMGGAALLLAEQRRPGTFAALYCFEPIVLDAELRRMVRSAGQDSLATGARRRREVFASRDEAYANYAAKPPLDVLAPEVLRAYVDHGFADRHDGTVGLKCRGVDESAIYTASGGHDGFDHLHRVACPVTVAAGAPTAHSPATFAEPIAAALPHGRFEQHRHLGHFGPLEAPRFVAERIRAALA